MMMMMAATTAINDTFYPPLVLPILPRIFAFCLS
jgi:hypothetical protein